MKKLFMVLCIVIMFFGIVGCPSSDDPSSSFSKTSITSGSTSDDTSTVSTITYTEPEGSDGTISDGKTTETVDGGGSYGANPVPEPATLILLGSGLVGLAGLGRKKFFKKD